MWESNLGTINVLEESSVTSVSNGTTREKCLPTFLQAVIPWQEISSGQFGEWTASWWDGLHRVSDKLARIEKSDPRRSAVEGSLLMTGHCVGLMHASPATLGDFLVNI